MATPSSLRPLGVGEILDAGIKVYLRHWKPFMICVVGIVLPVEILSVLVVASIDPDSLRTTFGSSSSGTTTVSESTAIAAEVVIAVVGLLSQLLVTAALFKGVCDAWLGSTPTAGRSLRFGAKRVFPLLGLAICGGVIVVVGLVLLILPGIWIGVCFSLSVPALLFERLGVFKSLGRSYRLVRGRWWPIFGTLLAGYLLAAIIGVLIQGVPVAIAHGISPDSTPVYSVAAVVGRTISSVITMPFTAAVIALLYFDQRVRKEGFDLQLMAAGLGASRDPDAPLPPPLVGPRYTEEQRAAAPYWPPPPGWVPPPPSAPEPAASGDREWWRDPLPDEAGSYGGYASPRAESDWQRDAHGRPIFPGSPSDDAPRPLYPGAVPEDDPADRSVLRAPWEAPPPRSPDAPSWADGPPPTSPLPGSPAGEDAAPAGEDAAPAGGDAAPAGGDAAPPPPDPAASPPGADPASPAGDAPKQRDRGRADWLPPEAPRGPGGL